MKPVRAAEAFFFTRVFPWIFVFGGVYVFSGGIIDLVQASRSNSWPTVQGRMLSAKASSVTHKNSTPEKAEVLYQYQVDDKTFTSKQIRIGRFNPDNPEGIKADVEKYHRQPNVRVFYSPGNPSMAVLEPGIHSVTWYKPIFGAVFLLLSCVAVRELRRRNSENSVL